MSFILQLSRLRLIGGAALRAQAGKQFLSTTNYRLGGRSGDDNTTTCHTDAHPTAKVKQEQVANKRKGSLKKNDSSEYAQESKKNTFFKPANYQSGTGAAGGVHPTGYPSRDNTLMKDKKGARRHDSKDNYSTSSSSSSSSSSDCNRDSPQKKKSGQLDRPTTANQRNASPSPVSSHKPYNLRTLGGEGDITKSFDNIKATDTEGGIRSAHGQAPPEGLFAGNAGNTVLDAVKQTGHNIMEKMSKAGEKTMEAGHNLADQAKNVMGMPPTRMPLDIARLEAKHEPQLNRFSIRLNDVNDEVAVLQYKKTGDNSIDYYHTEVPSNYRGNGIGSVLARVSILAARI